MGRLLCAGCEQPLGPTLVRCSACGAGAHPTCRTGDAPCPGCRAETPPVVAIPGRVHAGIQFAVFLPVFALTLAPVFLVIQFAARSELESLPWYDDRLTLLGVLLIVGGLIVGAYLARRRGSAYEGWIELHPDRIHVHKSSEHPVFAAESLTGYRLDPARRVVRLQVAGAWTPVRHAMAPEDDEGLVILLAWLDERGLPRLA